MRVLLVEDDKLLADGMCTALKREGYAVDHAARGEEALALIERAEPDLMVLDLGLPDIDGVDVITALRARGLQVPLLALTARDAVPDRVTGLRAGADDYLVKPFALSELLARIAVLARRGGAAAPGQQLVLAELRMDRRAHRAFLGDEPGVRVLLVDVHRATHHDEPVIRVHRGRQLAGMQPGAGQCMPLGAHPGLDAAEPLEGHMLEPLDPHHAPRAGMWPHAQQARPREFAREITCLARTSARPS